MKIQVLYAISALFATLAICDAFSQDEVLASEWKAYKAKHGKVYEDFEDDQRFEMFLKKKRQVAEHNKRFYSGQETYQIGINQFSDKLDHESGPRGCLRRPHDAREEAAGSVFVPPPANVELPTSVDWRKEGAVTPVKDQGYCGSCWAFSSTGALEGQHFLKTGKLVSLSEQNLVDCVNKEDEFNDGCMGGFMSDAFNYVAMNHGIDTERSYPYVAGTDGKKQRCKYSTRNIATDHGFTNITKGDEQALKAAVATVGPVSVAIDVEDDFLGYASGVFVSTLCTSYRMWLDHAVLVVGYGTDTKTGMDYWLVKNSWGAKWGEDGYFRMARNKNNMCGIATLAMYPNV